jgi:formamidopyrimidine-DNA glycosylase
MPELPEVETIAARLRHGKEAIPSLLGKKIVNSQVFWARNLASSSPEEFLQQIAGQTIQEIGRRGKFIVIRLSSGTLLIHLRMSGDLRVEPASFPIQPHDRVVFTLEDGLRLAFNDSRKFGRIWLVADPEMVTGGLGPEPLEESFTAQELFQMLHARRRQLKPLLLDQSFLSGLGNIYTDEALHLARLHPLALSDQLTSEEAVRLWESIRQVLDEGIRRQGASIDWVYRGGDFQNYFRVYSRTDEPCPECGTPIRRILVGQRSTHFCPQCQRPFES